MPSILVQLLTFAALAAASGLDWGTLSGFGFETDDVDRRRTGDCTDG